MGTPGAVISTVDTGIVRWKAVVASIEKLLEARAGLDELVTVLETQRYTTRPVKVPGEQMGAWVDAVERPLGSPVSTQES